MSRQWLKKEGPKWVKDGVITEGQYHVLLKRYPRKRYKSLLPLFASILIALGILSFVAANWQQIHELVRVSIIITAMAAFYWIGFRQYEKGNDRAGAGLAGIGVASFGAGIFLIGQMFHFVSFTASPFILWAIAGLGAAALIPSRFLLILPMLISIAGQVYIFGNFNSFSYILAAIFLLGAGHFVYHRASIETSAVFGLGYAVTGLLFVIAELESGLWMPVLLALLYFLGAVSGKNNVYWPFRWVSLFGGVVFSLFMVFSGGIAEELSQPVLLAVFFSAAAAVLFLIVSRTDKANLTDILLFLPWFYIGEAADVFYVILLLIYSILSLLIGYKEERIEKINFGTVVFLVSTLAAYIHLAWDFMPKSLFFLVGGVLLFALSWYLEKRRRAAGGSGGGHDE
ncbi:DUF2157 domain-containing protein [Bacillus marinisedimentorum]|uniref:DUF2157 domain-containing protein n=1 Tax=Bacillus marinisedimentorum TaxID=1821260 RepID=UPI000871E663|nr:DUF2157 domain-containing protein [Bacillus marinisedimentorum]